MPESIDKSYSGNILNRTYIIFNKVQSCIQSEDVYLQFKLILLELQLFNRKFYNEYQKMEIKMVNETKIIIKYLINVFIAEPFTDKNEHYSIFLIFTKTLNIK